MQSNLLGRPDEHIFNAYAQNKAPGSGRALFDKANRRGRPVKLRMCCLWR
jgi:hypothetical protein